MGAGLPGLSCRAGALSSRKQAHGNGHVRDPRWRSGPRAAPHPRRRHASLHACAARRDRNPGRRTVPGHRLRRRRVDVRARTRGRPRRPSDRHRPRRDQARDGAPRGRAAWVVERDVPAPKHHRVGARCPVRRRLCEVSADPPPRPRDVDRRAAPPHPSRWARHRRGHRFSRALRGARVPRRGSIRRAVHEGSAIPGRRSKHRPASSGAAPPGRLRRRAAATGPAGRAGGRHQAPHLCDLGADRRRRPAGGADDRG